MLMQIQATCICISMIFIPDSHKIPIRADFSVAVLFIGAHDKRSGQLQCCYVYTAKFNFQSGCG